MFNYEQAHKTKEYRDNYEETFGKAGRVRCSNCSCWVLVSAKRCWSCGKEIKVRDSDGRTEKLT